MDITTHHINMNKHIDFHSHILYGIDDGAKDIEMSVEIIKKMRDLGFERVVLTPHYRANYVANNTTKKEVLHNLQEELKRQNINMPLYLANEVHITSNILELIKNDTISLLGNYIFLELPFDVKIHNLDKVIYELQTNNINVILVHPERYSYMTIKDLQALVDKDVYLQVNFESIIGKYGMKAKSMVKKIYKNNLVSFVATDVHRPTTMMFTKFDKIEKKIIKIIGQEEYQKITYDNIYKIIQEIE